MARTKLNGTGQTAPVELTPEQQIAVQQLVSGASDQSAADAAGVARSTLSSWKHDDAFLAAVELARQLAWASCIDGLRALATDAVVVLRDNLHGDDERLRQAAALAVLKLVGIGGNTTLEPVGPTTAAAVRAKRNQAELYDLAFFS